MIFKKHIYDTFPAFEWDGGLFYKFENSLRFELSEGDSFIEQFLSAYQKCYKIISYINDAGGLWVGLVFYSDEQVLSKNLGFFRKLNDLEIKIPKNHEFWNNWDKESEMWKHHILFPIKKIDLCKHVWMALSSELGIKPTLDCRVYFFYEKIIIHPYDDRGMDIIGMEYEPIKELYVTFNKYLFHYDRLKMDSNFSSEI